MWWQGRFVAGSETKVNQEGTHDDVVVKVKYLDDRGRKYSDAIELTVTPFLERLVTVSTDSLPGRLKQISENSKKLAVAAEKIASIQEKTSR